MRAVGVALLVAAAATLAAQPARPEAGLVVVIDADTPTADPTTDARLRTELLERLDPEATAAYYELSAEGLAAVPAAAAAEVRRTVYTVSAPSYNGLAITFAESVEILRGNESVRDAVIARACAPGPRSCGGLVRAAAEAEVKRVEATSAAKLAAVATRAGDWRGQTVVLVTSGWATRDERRVGVRRALTRVRTARVALVVVQPAPREPFRGLVRDAAASLAAQVPSDLRPLVVSVDVGDVAALVEARAGRSGARPVVKVAPTPAPPAVMAAAAEAPAAPAGDPGADAGAGTPLDATLRKAAAYVERFEQAFTSVVWHERYEQHDRVRRRFGSSGNATWVVAGRRLLEPECVFVWLPTDRTWMAVRDVLAVDGARRPASERWLPRLEAQPAVTLPELRDLARENGRFNLGRIVRTFNEPTLPLLFLDARVRDGVRFTRLGSRGVDRRRVATYSFVERGRPTLIRSGVRDVPATGTLDIDEDTGEIVRAVVEVVGEEGGLTGRMTVDFQPFAGFDVLVPVEMREAYARLGTEEITATAAYSAFRRFRTTARLILTPP